MCHEENLELLSTIKDIHYKVCKLILLLKFDNSTANRLVDSFDCVIKFLLKEGTTTLKNYRIYNLVIDVQNMDILFDLDIEFLDSEKATLTLSLQQSLHNGRLDNL